MTPKVVTLSKYIMRASAVLVVAMGASACSTMSDLDPTGWIGGSDNDQASMPADQSAQTADNNTQTPDLSQIPDKPQTPSTADEQRDVTQSLASDRSKAQYSADTLRGGTEPSAAPPPTDAAPSTEELAANDNAAPPPEPPKPAGPPPRPAAGPGTLPSDSQADNTAVQAAQQPAAAPAPEVASAAVPPPAAPTAPAAVPAVPAVAPGIQTTDASLGFRPSTAPPLDASVAQFVPPSIMARYAQSASITGGQPAVPTGDTAYAANTKRSKSRRGVGGPEGMSGAVVANFDALGGGAVAPTAYAGGVPGAPASVVFFPRDTTILDDEAKAQVREAAKAFLARGGQGYVRVVGHASSQASMTGERQLVWNFERSQARASAVARALIAQGVPADKVLVQAVGNDQSGYDVTAPQGQDGSRRADIIFES